MLEAFQWLIAFIPSEKRTAWELMNSQVLSTIIGIIVSLLIARYGRAAVANAETSQSVVSANNIALKLEDENPEPRIEPEVQDEPTFRLETREVVKKAKDFLNDLASEDPDGRHKRTYNAISRHDYVVLAVALNERGQLTDDQLSAAYDIFSEWAAYERRNGGRHVPKTAHDAIKVAYKKLVSKKK